MLAILILAESIPIQPEFELSLGLAHSLQSAGGGDPYALAVPALQGRVGIDLFDRVSVGVEVLAILGEQAQGLSNFGTFNALAGFASVRLHTRGKVRLYFEGGLGPGHLITLQFQPNDENYPLNGRGGLSEELGLGATWFIAPKWSLSLGGQWVRFTNVGGSGCCGESSSAVYDQSTTALLLSLTLGFSPGR